MEQSQYGRTAQIIGQMTDPNQLTQMLKNPQYAGFTNVIIARLTEIQHLRSAAQSAQPPQPTVAQQAVQGTEMPQGMARGGIIAFKHGGEVKGYADGGTLYAAKQYDWLGRPIKADDDTVAPDNSTSSRWGAGTKGAGKSFLDYIRMKPTMYPAPPGQLPPDSPIDDLAEWRKTHPEEPSAITPTQYNVRDMFPGGDQGGYNGARSQGARVSVPASGSDIVAPTIIRRTAPEYTKEMVDFLGPDKELDTAQAQMGKLQAAREAQAAQSPWMAVMRAGLGMAQGASENPRAGSLGNLAAGVTAGLGQYQTEREALNKGQEAELQRQIQMAGIRRQERGDEFKYGALQARTDMQDQRAIDVAQLQGKYALAGHQITANAQERAAGTQNKQWQLEDQRAQQRAAELAQADIDTSTGKARQGPMYYYGLAKQEINAAMYGSGIRGAASQANARLVAATKELSGGMASPARAAYLQQVIDSGGEFGQETTGAIRPR